MANAQRGFTLLEMLVVIVLISLAAGLVGFGLQQGLRAAKERQAVGRSSRRYVARGRGQL
ncbi:type II secretion system protein [Pseudomonas lactucae]|uniref:type II secretion system protein n=1 Tax=Pseudomonas lactucae TaxID=2813360 RepID=UPI001CEDBE8F